VNEDDGLIGPTCGCLRGCTEYWCCCKGPWKLYCGRKSSKVVALNSLESGSAVASAAHTGTGTGTTILTPIGPMPRPGVVDEAPEEAYAPWCQTPRREATEDAFMASVAAALVEKGAISMDEWLVLSWEHGCDPIGGLPAMALVFRDMDTDGKGTVTKIQAEVWWAFQDVGPDEATW